MTRSLLLLLGCALGCAGLHLAPRVPWATPTGRAMRSRLSRHAVTLMADDGGADAKAGEEQEEAGSQNFLKTLFTTNRGTPEAIANQKAWARQQMDLEVPEATLGGDSISDRDDLVKKYIASEKDKFGRDVDQATAEAEIDEWLLKQATYAPSKTTAVDLALAATVFVGAFAAGLFFANKSG